MTFKDKVVLINGGCTAIGKAAAIQFAEAGAQLLISGGDAPKVEKVVREVRQTGGEAVAFLSKFSSPGEIKAMVNEVVDTFGGLHIAVNNVTAELEYGLIHEIKEHGWDNVIDLTLKSVWLALKYEIPAIKKSGGGAIVNVASASGINASPGLSAFSAAKAGVVSLSKSAAAEVARDNVRINSICPGGVATYSLERLFESEPDLKDSLESAHAMGRMARPDEIASCIRFLCSDDSSFLTGDNLVVDGGGVMAKI